MTLINLLNLYSKIHECHLCPQMDRHKEYRNIKAVSFNTQVFVISQALAESQLRMSGVNFFQLDGKAGSTGKQLEKFLNLINHTIYPAEEIELKNGSKIIKHNPNYTPVYNTEVTQCFPGKGQKGDRLPNNTEIMNCLNNNFLVEEINIIRPKLLLLMGKLSISTFYKFILRTEVKKNTSELINQIVQNSKVPETYLNGNLVGYVPIQHASGLNPHYNQMLKYNGYIDLINKYLSDE